MNEQDEKLLEKYGWTVECYSPFEIRTKDGSFARDEASQYVLDGIRMENYYDELNQKDFINDKILDSIYYSIISEGGDGDAIWLSKHTSLNDIKILLDKYNTSNNIDWNIEEKDNCLLWGIGEECAIITCDENFFNSQPNYITLRINY